LKRDAHAARSNPKQAANFELFVFFRRESKVVVFVCVCVVCVRRVCARVACPTLASKKGKNRKCEKIVQKKKRFFFSFLTRADAESVPNAARRRGAHTRQRVRAEPPCTGARRGPAECHKRKKTRKKPEKSEKK
jgi:hypothetical protein